MKFFNVFVCLIFATILTEYLTKKEFEGRYTAALIEMSASYEAARNQKVCDAEKIVVALSQCKKRSA